MNKAVLIIMSLMTTLHAYTTLTIQPQTVSQELTLHGQLTPKAIIPIQLSFDAKLEPLIPFGSHVTKGQAIFKVVSAEKPANTLSLINKYLATEQRLLIQSEAFHAKQELMNVQAISKRAFRESLLEFDHAQIEYLEAKNTLEHELSTYGTHLEELDTLKQKSLQEIDTYIQEHLLRSLTAPSHGLFLPSCSGRQEEQPTIHKKLSPIACIVDDTLVEINLSVGEHDVNNLSVGHTAHITIPALDLSMPGHIESVSPYPTDIHTNQQTQYPTVIHFDDPTSETLQALKMGMHVIVSIQTHAEEAMMVPIRAITTLQGESYLEKLNTKQKPFLQKVSLGDTDHMNIRILEGLEPGDEIIVRD